MYLTVTWVDPFFNLQPINQIIVGGSKEV